MSFLGELFSGVNSQDTGMAKHASQFYDTLSNEQNTMFGMDENALNTIHTQMAPIVNGGIHQYGLSTAEDLNLQNQIETAGATATENSVASEQLRQQQLSGGAGVLPSGAGAATEMMAREVGAQKTAGALSQEKEMGYQVGRENFLAAANEENQVASLSNPTGFASAATSAGGLALDTQKYVDQRKASGLGAKLLGGAIQGGISAFTGGLGSLLGGGSFLSGVSQSLGGSPSNAPASPGSFPPSPDGATGY